MRLKIEHGKNGGSEAARGSSGHCFGFGEDFFWKRYFLWKELKYPFVYIPKTYLAYPKLTTGPGGSNRLGKVFFSTSR